MKKISFLMISLALAIFMVSIASAVTLDSGTILNATGSNSTMTFSSCSLEVTTAVVNSDSIVITGAQRLIVGDFQYDFPSSFTHSVENTNYDCGEIGIKFGSAINSCSNATKAGYRLIMLLSAIALVVFIVVFIFKDGLEGLTLGKLIVLFISIIVAVILWQASGQNLGASCGVVG